MQNSSQGGMVVEDALDTVAQFQPGHPFTLDRGTWFVHRHKTGLSITDHSTWMKGTPWQYTH